MNPILKSRDYHRSYQKWDNLLLEGKVDEIMIVAGAKSEVSFVLRLKKKCKNNSGRILQALTQLPKETFSLNDVRNDYDSKVRL